MTADCYIRTDRLTANYSLEHSGRTHRVWAVGDEATSIPPPDSAEHFFKERQWGFGKTRDGKLLTYEVQHPEWACHAVRDYGLDLDWTMLYGDRWNGMNGKEPESVFIAQGSTVSVYPHGAAFPCAGCCAFDHDGQRRTDPARLEFRDTPAPPDPRG